jgi:DNA-damage-inducible protein J
MARTAVLNIRIDPDTKAEAEQLFSSFGLTVTDAINVFLRQALMEHGFPFSLKQPRYNAETERAIRDVQNGVDLHRCDSLGQLVEELNAE